MARIRTIKPGFFFNEDLVALPPFTRLFFIGLWTQVDREGRCEDRPVRLKANLFPYDVVDVEVMILELVAYGHLVRYSVDGVKILAVPNFLKHQIPHYKEVPSILPPIPKDFKVDSTLNQRRVNVKSIMTQPCTQEGKGREQEGKGTVIAVPSEPDSVVLAKPKPDLTRIVEAYKHAKGVPMDDKAWDKAQWSRASKAGKSLLACFNGNLDEAAAYLFYRAEHLKSIGLEWTFETITKHAWDGMGMAKEKNDGLGNQPLGSDSVLGQRSTRRITSSGSIVGEALRGLEHAAIRAEGSGDLGGPDFDRAGDED